MENRKTKEHLQDFIDKEKWAEVLTRFIEVLRINIFLVDSGGRLLLAPCKDRYGWNLFVASPLGFSLLNQQSGILEKFRKHGFYLEYSYPFDLHNFAIPIKLDEEKTLAYIIVGPVILNKRLEKEEYARIAREMKIDEHTLCDLINEIRTMSFIGIKSVLDLLDEVARYVMQLTVQNRDLEKRLSQRDALSRGLSEAVQDIQSAIRVDELLVALLDVALHVTRAECGTIMITDPATGELTIRASRGIGRDIAQKARTKLGEGVAGTAAQDNVSFLIHGTETTNNRIKPFLKRPDVRYALVTPLSVNNRVLGVLNLHTKKADVQLLDESLDTVKMLSRLASFAIGAGGQPPAPSAGA